MISNLLKKPFEVIVLNLRSLMTGLTAPGLRLSKQAALTRAAALQVM